MALIQNNLVINKNSKRYPPFLVNLLSGRRRRLTSDEFELICSMLDKESQSGYSNDERDLHEKLTSEKQFFSDTLRNELESKMIQSSMFKPNIEPVDDLNFTIALTMDCNMNCYYCYEREFNDRNSYMTREHIDAIFDFYTFCRNEYDAKGSITEIGVTGGESLINRKTSRLVKYISEKWSDAKVSVITNGVNLLKYYDELPIGKSFKVCVSLDGLKETHLKRRYSGETVDGKIYDDIILGIKKLLSDGVEVRIQSVIDRNNYLEFPKLHEFLITENISTSPNYSFTSGHANDFSNPCNIDEKLNSKQEIATMREFLLENRLPYGVPYLGLSRLSDLIGRPANEPFVPKHYYCDTGYLSKNLFAPDGKIYFCNIFNEDKGVIGTYFPKISIDKEAALRLAKRSVMEHGKCLQCPYKFVCLGGCPKVSEGVGEEMTCGVFSDSSIMDNLEYYY